MEIDVIQDIEVLRKLLKELMCKCIKEIELKNHEGKIIKTVPGEYYYYDFVDEYSEYGVFDGTGYHISMLDFEWKEKGMKNFNEYFKIKEGD